LTDIAGKKQKTNNEAGLLLLLPLQPKVHMKKKPT